MVLRSLPNPVQALRLRSLQRSVRHLHGPLTVATARLEAVVLCVVKDGECLVDAFIEHYLQLGFKHIFFLDNGSTDSTREIIAARQQTTLLTSSEPFSYYYILFKDYLIQTFGLGKWCVLADIDEFIYQPESTPLEIILAYLNERNYDTACIQMLDMFAKAPLSLGAAHLPKNKQKKWTLSQLASTFCHYDLKDIERRKYVRWFGSRIHPAHRFFFGGIRKTVFNRDCFLTKEVMFFAQKNTRLASSHLLSSHLLKGSNLADFSLAFLHYKFTEDFYTSTKEAVAAENHWRNSCEYKAYLDVLTATNRQTGLTLHQPSSQKLKRFDDLASAEFVFSSDEFATFLSRVA